MSHDCGWWLQILSLGRLCGLAPAISMVADDTAVVTGLLVGLASEEGASIFAGRVACACAVASFFCAGCILCSVLEQFLVLIFYFWSILFCFC